MTDELDIKRAEWDRNFAGVVLPEKVIDLLSESILGPLWGSLKDKEKKEDKEQGTSITIRIPESLALRIAYRKENSPRYKWTSDVVRHWTAVGVFIEEIIAEGGFYAKAIEAELIERRLYEKMKTLESQYKFVERLEDLIRQMQRAHDYEGVDQIREEAKAYFAIAATEVIKAKIRSVFPDIGN